MASEKSGAISFYALPLSLALSKDWGPLRNTFRSSAQPVLDGGGSRSERGQFLVKLHKLNTAGSKPARKATPGDDMSFFSTTGEPKGNAREALYHDLQVECA
jgi:hypothetical protein